MIQRRKRKNLRLGSIAPLTAVLLVPLLTFVALAVDVGYIALAKTQLQSAADTAALAAAAQMITSEGATGQTKARDHAKNFAAANMAASDRVLLDVNADVEFGFWDSSSRSFLPPGSSGDPNVIVNAVRVRAHRDSNNTAGPVRLFFARVLGIDEWDLQAESIAFAPSPARGRKQGGMGTRFLIDDEMFDTDEPAIEALANKLGKKPDDLLKAKDEKSEKKTDWFLDIPAGVRLELPTGQVGDEALLDIAANMGKPDLPQYRLLTGQIMCDSYTSTRRVRAIKCRNTAEDR